MCKFCNSYEESLNLGVCKLAKYVIKRLRCFLGKIYTADKKFTRPLVAEVATYFKSECNVTNQQSQRGNSALITGMILDS